MGAAGRRKETIGAGRRGAGSWPRLMLGLFLSYLIVAQGVVGALAAGALAGHGSAGTLLCTPAADTDAGGGASHDGVLRALHCLACPAAGGVPMLAAAPRLPLPAPLVVATLPLPGDLVSLAAPTPTAARPRAPPTAA